MAYKAPEVSYEFKFAGGEQNLYLFTTGQEIVYEIKFVPSSYLFVGYVEEPVSAFEMVITVADNPSGKRLPADKRTEPTIRDIFYDFFRAKEHVIIYICDSSDGRQEARMRKFTNWYYKNIAVDLFKMDARLPDGERFTLLSGILSKRNPHFSQFVELFKDLAEADK